MRAGFYFRLVGIAVVGAISSELVAELWLRLRLAGLTTALLAARLLRAVDDRVRHPSPPDRRPVGVWVAAPVGSPWSERMLV